MRHALASRVILTAALLAAPTLGVIVLTHRVACAQAPAPASVVLHVDGMHCATCPLTVRTVLRRLDGVRAASVSAEERTARVTYDPAHVTPERMIRAIEDAGYHARVER